MPPPRRLEPLPRANASHFAEIPHLPHPLRRLAEAVIACPQSSPDYLFPAANPAGFGELADALDEVATQDRSIPMALATNFLAGELRRRAPEYA